MQRRTLVALALVAAAVGALVWWDRGRPSTDEARARADRLAPGFERSAALAIERGGDRFSLVEEHDHWWVEEGSTRRLADEARVEQLLGVLEFGRATRTLALDDAARLGLSPPRAVVRARGVVLAVGGEAPGGEVYARRGVERVALVAEKRLGSLLDAPATAWVSRALVVDDPESAHRIAIGDWAVVPGAPPRLEGPRPGRADPSRVEALVAALGSTGVLAGATSPDAGAPSGQAVTFDGRLQSRLEGPCPADAGPDRVRVARADGVLLCAPRAQLTPLLDGPDGLRERRLVPLSLDEITGLELRRSTGPLVLHREAHAWRITQPVSLPADDAAVRAALGAILALTAPPGAAPEGAVTPLATVVVTTPKERVELTVGVAGTTLVAARPDGERFVAPPATRAALDLDPLQLRSRRLVSVRPADVRALTVTDAGRPPRTRTPGAGADPQLEAAADLRALDFPRAPRFTAARTLRLALPAGPIEIALSARAPDGSCLTRVGEQPVARLAPATCASLWL